VRVFSSSRKEGDPHPSPLPEYRAREKSRTVLCCPKSFAFHVILALFEFAPRSVRTSIECADVKFHLAAVGNEPAASRLKFDILVDPKKWQEVEAPQRTDDVSKIVREFLSDYPQSEREDWAEKARRKKSVAHRLLEYRIDPADIEERLLIPNRRRLRWRWHGKNGSPGPRPNFGGATRR